MARDVFVMVTLFQILILFLLLLLISFAVPKLHPLLYTVLFLTMFFILFTSVILPFVDQFLALFAAFSNPYLTLLIGSAILFYVSELITAHIAELGYQSLANMGHFAMKITILLLWMNEISAVIEQLSLFISQ